LNNDSAIASGDQYWQDLAVKVTMGAFPAGYYQGPIDGVIGPVQLFFLLAPQWPEQNAVIPGL